jgi:hypothetical protein
VKVTQRRFCRTGKLFERQRVLAGLEKMPLVAETMIKTEKAKVI